MANTPKSKNETTTTRKRRTTAAEKAKEPVEGQQTIAEPPKEPTFTQAQVEEMIAKATAEAVAKAMANIPQPAPQTTQIIQVADNEKVVMRFQAELADDNIATFGPNGMYGQVTGKRGTVIVPKSEWSRFYDEQTRHMIDNRWLVVISGMDDDERHRFNCDYKAGEVLDEQAFDKLLDMGDELIDIFTMLCVSHQEMVGRRYLDAWYAQDTRVRDRARVTKLNELSRKTYANAPDGDIRKKGIFWPIIEGLNKEDSRE